MAQILQFLGRLFARLFYLSFVVALIMTVVSSWASAKILWFITGGLFVLAVIMTFVGSLIEFHNQDDVIY